MVDEDAECGRPCHLRNGRARGRCLIHHRSRGVRRAGSLHASHPIQEIGNKVIAGVEGQCRSRRHGTGHAPTAEREAQGSAHASGVRPGRARGGDDSRRGHCARGAEGAAHEPELRGARAGRSPARYRHRVRGGLLRRQDHPTRGVSGRLRVPQARAGRPRRLGPVPSREEPSPGARGGPAVGGAGAGAARARAAGLAHAGRADEGGGRHPGPVARRSPTECL
jgi:hypothetical protein